MVINIIQFLKRINASGFVFIGLISILLVSSIFGIFSSPGSSAGNPLFLENKYVVFFIAVFISPFIETIIYQSIPFYLTRKYIKIKRKFCLYIFVAPILFIHSFNPAYIAVSYTIGIVLAFLYYIAYYRKENAILLISLIHLLNNLLAFSVHYLL